MLSSILTIISVLSKQYANMCNTIFIDSKINNDFMYHHCFWLFSFSQNFHCFAVGIFLLLWEYLSCLAVRLVFIIMRILLLLENFSFNMIIFLVSWEFFFWYVNLSFNVRIFVLMWELSFVCCEIFSNIVRIFLLKILLSTVRISPQSNSF